MPDHAAHAGYQAERLSIDLLYLRVEVGQQQPGQLKAALIHHEPAHCRRRGTRRSSEYGRAASVPAATAPNRQSRPAAIGPAGIPALSRRRTGHRLPDRIPSAARRTVPPWDQTVETSRSHCSRNPDFADPVLMIIRNCSRICGSDTACRFRTIMSNHTPLVSGALVIEQRGLAGFPNDHEQSKVQPWLAQAARPGRASGSAGTAASFLRTMRRANALVTVVA